MIPVHAAAEKNIKNVAALTNKKGAAFFYSTALNHNPPLLNRI